MMRRAFCFLAAVVLLAPIAAISQEKKTSKQAVEKRLKAVETERVSPAIEEAIHALNAASGFDQAAVSPDGKKVAWVEEFRDKNGADSGYSGIFATAIDHKTPVRKITAASVPRAESGIAWAPDSPRIAFISDAAKPGQSQLYLEGASGQPARRLTDVKGTLASAKFSPDGKTIAVLFTENAPRAAGPLVAEVPETGEIKDAFFEQRLAVVDIATGKLRQVSPADTYVYQYDWSPDGLNFVVSSALGNGDNNWWTAELSVLDATSGLMKSIYKPSLQISYPAWSPDGKSIAFIECLMSDEDSVGGDIFLRNTWDLGSFRFGVRRWKSFRRHPQFFFRSSGNLGRSQRRMEANHAPQQRRFRRVGRSQKYSLEIGFLRSARLACLPCEFRSRGKISIDC